MKQKIQRFMTGRYGADQLGQIYLGASMALLLISLFSRWNILDRKSTRLNSSHQF